MTACPYINVKYPVSPWGHPNIAGSITPAASVLVQNVLTMVVKLSNVWTACFKESKEMETKAITSKRKVRKAIHWRLLVASECQQIKKMCRIWTELLLKYVKFSNVLNCNNCSYWFYCPPAISPFSCLFPIRILKILMGNKRKNTCQLWSREKQLHREYLNELRFLTESRMSFSSNLPQTFCVGSVRAC